jgi:hypothetical protein
MNLIFFFVVVVYDLIVFFSSDSVVGHARLKSRCRPKLVALQLLAGYYRQRNRLCEAAASFKNLALIMYAHYVAIFLIDSFALSLADT